MVPSIFGQFTVGGHMNALVRYHSHEGKMTPNSLIFWRVATAKKVHFRLGHAQVICHCDAKQFFGHQYHFSYTQKNLRKLLLLQCFFKKSENYTRTYFTWKMHSCILFIVYEFEIWVGDMLCNIITMFKNYQKLSHVWILKKKCRIAILDSLARKFKCCSLRSQFCNETNSLDFQPLWALRKVYKYRST